MRSVIILLLFGLSVKALPQVVKAEYFFDDATVALGQGISLAVPPNTGDVQITETLPVNSLSPGFHQVFFRVKDVVKGWSPVTPKPFIKLHPNQLIVGFSYCIDELYNGNFWKYVAFPSPAINVSMETDIPLNNLSPGFHQVFFKAIDVSGGWSPFTPKSFLKSSPPDTISGFSYCIDAQSGSEVWTYKAFPESSTDVSMDIDIDLEGLSKGIHYFEAAAKTKSGCWTPISKGTFFNLYSEPLNITSLEYFFEDENGVISSLFSTNDFTHSPNVTLDSVTFSVPASMLVDLQKYYFNLRAVDDAGNRSLYIQDTLVYHVFTGIIDRISLTPELLVFPNPVSEIVNFKFVKLDEQGDFIFMLFDESGRKVAEDKFSFSKGNQNSYDTSNLNSGIYSCAIYSDSGKLVAKATFIKK